VEVQTSWDPRKCGTYHDLLDREERKLDEAFGGMMPDELPSAVVEVAEVWLGGAYDNITMAQACLAVRRQHEEGQIVTPEEHPEPPDGEASAEKAQRLWIPRALRQTSYVSHMAREVCEDSTQADWGVWAYREYRRLLDDEMMAVCRIYAEVELADLPVREGKEAQGWLMIMHRNIERTREHIGMRIRGAGEWGAPPSLPVGGYSHRQREKRRAVRATLQAEAAATRARLQAARVTGMPGRSQLAGKRTLRPRRQEAAGPEALPTRVHLAKPRQAWRN
jgi:hypothetical protein